jgi:hypothetical protein
MRSLTRTSCNFKYLTIFVRFRFCNSDSTISCSHGHVFSFHFDGPCFLGHCAIIAGVDCSNLFNDQFCQNVKCKRLTALPIDTMAPAGIINSFVAAIQASLSVILVIFYGAVAARFKLLDASSSKSISKICVKIFLPALLLTKIGSELHGGSADRYAIILLWALVCHFVSFLIGIAAHLLFGMPDWITAALMFNNTTRFVFFLDFVCFYLRLVQELQDCVLRSLTGWIVQIIGTIVPSLLITIPVSSSETSSAIWLFRNRKLVLSLNS